MMPVTARTTSSILSYHDGHPFDPFCPECHWKHNSLLYNPYPENPRLWGVGVGDYDPLWKYHTTTVTSTSPPLQFERRFASDKMPQILQDALVANRYDNIKLAAQSWGD